MGAVCHAPLWKAPSVRVPGVGVSLPSIPLLGISQGPVSFGSRLCQKVYSTFRSYWTILLLSSDDSAGPGFPLPFVCGFPDNLIV